MRLPQTRGRTAALAAAVALAVGWQVSAGFAQSVISSTGSNSMSHAEEPLPGVLDPGEWRRLGPVDDRSDVTTFLEGRETGHRVGADFGDVVTYRPVHRGQPVEGKLVNHRALAWVVYNGTADAYNVPALGIEGETSFVVPGVGRWDPRADRYVRGDLPVRLDPDLHGRHDGVLTKGDHNPGTDQSTTRGLQGIGTVELVEPERIHGRVVAHTDTTTIQLMQLGVPIGALVAAVGLLAARRHWRSGLARRMGRCPRCAAERAAEGDFCRRCGESLDG